MSTPAPVTSSYQDVKEGRPVRVGTCGQCGGPVYLRVRSDFFVDQKWAVGCPSPSCPNNVQDHEFDSLYEAGVYCEKEGYYGPKQEVRDGQA